MNRLKWAAWFLAGSSAVNVVALVGQALTGIDTIATGVQTLFTIMSYGAGSLLADAYKARSERRRAEVPR